jgi:hypothetical protein
MAPTYNDIPPGAVAVAPIGTVPKGVPGNRYTKSVRVTGDAAYPTGGYAPPTLNQLGFSDQIDSCLISNEHPGATASYWLWNTLTQKLQLIVTATGAELANGQDAHLAFCDCLFIGF